MTLAALWHSCRQGSFLSPWLFTRVSPQALDLIAQLISKYLISNIYLDFPSCLGFSPVLKHLTLHYIVHDVVSQKIERRPLLGFMRQSVLRIECSLLAHILHCYTLSRKDALKCQEIGYTGSIEVIVPDNLQMGRVNDGTPIIEIVNQFPGRRNLVFFGNMQRAENHYSILRFLLTSYPMIWLRHRDVQCWILGLAPRRLLRLIAILLPGVRVTGSVDDPNQAFREATFCIAPVYYGAGVKIKVLQMLEAGATVVSTPIGAEGIPHSDKLITVKNHQLAAAIKSQLGRAR
ncbi:glycosyltransferase family 4 protein [Methylobacillus gramineus]|uniref:glycosyltransferase family 4 protein n=1 Tax=Methylobacillus gramineus TaxID=755169 RepID=UPI001CFFFD1A|nr:glycosyltransferase family 4 protein [Methylobacillus gramineus]MCB5184129.1 glycosyltransferase family 4 protein [Methylobacillus gramineus]